MFCCCYYNNLALRKKLNIRFPPLSQSGLCAIILSLMIVSYMNICPWQLCQMFEEFFTLQYQLYTNRPIKVFPVSLATALALAVNEAIKLMLEHKAGEKRVNTGTLGARHDYPFYTKFSTEWSITHLDEIISRWSPIKKHIVSLIRIVSDAFWLSCTVIPNYQDFCNSVVGLFWHTKREQESNAFGKQGEMWPLKLL